MEKLPEPTAAAVYRCRKHKTVEVALYVPATPYCAVCGNALKLVGHAEPAQLQLFTEAAA